MKPVLSLLFLALSLCGCAATPDNRYFMLVPQPGAPMPTGGVALAGLRLPALTDRPQLVLQSQPHSVSLREFERWAEPLDQMTARVLAADLALRQPPAVTAWRVQLVVDAFIVDQDHVARLEGSWWLQPTDSAPGPRWRFALSRPAAGAEADAIAAAMSQLLGDLADLILAAPAVRGL